MIIYTNKKEALKMFLATLFCCIIFAFFAFFDMRELSGGSSAFDNVYFYWICRIFCCAMLTILVFAAAFSLKTLVSKKPLIEITPDALIDSSSAISLGKILWSDMEFVFIKGAFFSIILKDPEKYLEKASPLKKLLIKWNMKMGYGQVCINPVLFSKDFLEFVKCFNRYMPIPEIMEMMPPDPKETL